MTKTKTNRTKNKLEGPAARARNQRKQYNRLIKGKTPRSTRARRRQRVTKLRGIAILVTPGQPTVEVKNPEKVTMGDVADCMHDSKWPVDAEPGKA